MTESQPRTFQGQVRNYLGGRVGRPVPLERLCRKFSGASEAQVRNAIYGLRRAGVGVHVLKPGVYVYRPDEAPVRSGHGRKEEGERLAVVRRVNKSTLMCVDAEGVRWRAQRLP